MAAACLSLCLPCLSRAAELCGACFTWAQQQAQHRQEVQAQGKARHVRRGNAFSTWLQLLLCGGTGTVLNASHLAMQIAVVKQKAKSACGGLWVLHLSRLQCVLSPSAAVELFQLMQGSHGQCLHVCMTQELAFNSMLC